MFFKTLFKTMSIFLVCIALIVHANAGEKTEGKTDHGRKEVLAGKRNRCMLPFLLPLERLECRRQGFAVSMCKPYSRIMIPGCPTLFRPQGPVVDKGERRLFPGNGVDWRHHHDRPSIFDRKPGCQFDDRFNRARNFPRMGC